jgi:undecaprenyl-diphosphatase
MLRELPDIVLTVVAVAFAAVGAWAAADQHSRAAVWVGRASRVVGGRLWLALAVFSAILFLAIAEDVLWPDDQDWMTMLDRQIEVSGRAMGRDPVIHAVARGVSLGTGVGLGVAVLGAATALIWARQRRAAFLLLAGTAGAWLTHAIVKLAFRVPRPSLRMAAEDPRGYGFPSGHTVVTLVVVGLLVWISSHWLPRRARFALYAAGLLLASVTGAARIVLHAHRLSDVLAGLALGMVFLAMAIGWAGLRPPIPPLRHP